MAGFTAYVDGGQIASELADSNEDAATCFVTFAHLFEKFSSDDREYFGELLLGEIGSNEKSKKQMAAFAAFLTEFAK